MRTIYVRHTCDTDRVVEISHTDTTYYVEASDLSTGLDTTCAQVALNEYVSLCQCERDN